MRAAVLRQLGAPEPGHFEEPPAVAAGIEVVEVLAAAVNHLDLMKASGRFYTGVPPLPSVVGSDGVGRRSDGTLVYFDSPVAPFGSMAQRAVVPTESLIAVPPGADPTVAAALGNAGIAAHTSLAWRAGLERGETVLVLGATGVVGSIAIQVARLMGAGRIVAAGRDPARLARTLELGAHEAVAIGADSRTEALRGADVILDLVWGPPAAAALAGAASGVRLIQVGHLAGPEAPLSAPVIRSRAAEIRGHAVFQAPHDVRADAYRQVVEAAVKGEIVVNVELVALEDVASGWRRQAQGTRGTKLVVRP